MAANFRVNTDLDNDAALLDAFERVRASDEANAQLFIEYARGFEQAGLFSECFEAIAEALKKGPTSAAEFVQLADLYSVPLGLALHRAEGWLELAHEALTLYRQAFNLDPFNLDAIRGMVETSLMVYEQEELSGVIILCHRWSSLVVDDRDAEADPAFKLLMCHYLQGSREEASRLVDMLLERMPDSPAFLFGKGLIELKGDPTEFSQSVNSLRALDQGLAGALLLLSSLQTVKYRDIACALLTTQVI